MPPRARSAQSGRVIATTSSQIDREVDGLFALGFERLLANESADARRRRRAGLRRLGDTHRVVAHRGRIIGVRLEQIRRGHDRIERVVHVVHHAGGELADGGEPTLASARFLQREQLLRALLHHPLEALGFRRHALVQACGAPRFFLERLRELRLHRHVAFDGDRAANLSVLVVERVRVDLDDHRRAVGAATDGERLAAHALAAQRARRRVLVHEQARSVDRARAVELPQLAQRRRLAGRVVRERLGVRAHRSALGVEHAHGVWNDVEDRLELRDVSAEGFAEIFSLADVVAGEEQAAPPRFLGERRERRLDESPAERGAGTECAPRSARVEPRSAEVDVIGEVGERVRETRRRSRPRAGTNDATPVNSR